MNEINIFAHYPDCAIDRHKLRGVLMDFFPDDQINANLIIIAFDAGIVSVIKKAQKLDEDIQMKIWNRLVEEFGVQKEKAGWAVTYWMSNYGAYLLRKSYEFVEFPSEEAKRSAPSKMITLERYEEELLKAKVSVEAAVSEAEKSKADLEAARSQISSLNAELLSSRSETASLTAELAEIKEELRAAKAKAEKATTETPTAVAKMSTSSESTTKSNCDSGTKDNEGISRNSVVVEGSIAIASMKAGDKLPKERIVLYPDEYEALGITNFRATAFYDYEFDGYITMSVKGEYDGRTKDNLLIMPMVFNSRNELIAVEFDGAISAKIRSHKTYSNRFRVPNNEDISRVEIKIIKDPVFLG